MFHNGDATGKKLLLSAEHILAEEIMSKLESDISHVCVKIKGNVH